MNFLNIFLHQKVPKAGAEMPLYYRKALITSETLLAVYLPLFYFLTGMTTHNWEPLPLLTFACVIICIVCNHRLNIHLNLCAFAAIIFVWCSGCLYRYGWSIGIQHFLLPLLMLSFFNIHEPPWLKILVFLSLIVYRMGLFAYSLDHPPLYVLDQTASIAIQMLNSVITFLILACDCILFSTNLQETERQLRLDNQQLHKQAGTDPLTQLPNRRAMLDEIDAFINTETTQTFSVAIADIDHFKNVNDTYGHNCGDYTLRTLADLFRTSAGMDYRVCRWGGEEFCFFLPGLNIDDAGRVMNDLCYAVRRMPLSFEGTGFSITITIGVEEYDFSSPLTEIIESADQKLYMGKNSGRNQVVI